MPSLVEILEDKVVEETKSPVTVATSNNTPKKSPSDSDAATPSEVTPGSSDSKNKNQQDQSVVKKQATLMSFFGAATKRKSTPKANAKPRGPSKICARKSTVKPSLQTSSSIASTNKKLTKHLLKKKKDSLKEHAVVKDSLRDIVLGSVSSPVRQQTPIVLDYSKHKGSPMPTNLSVPSITKNMPLRRCLLDRLNNECSPQERTTTTLSQTPIVPEDECSSSTTTTDHLAQPSKSSLKNTDPLLKPTKTFPDDNSASRVDAFVQPTQKSVTEEERSTSLSAPPPTQPSINEETLCSSTQEVPSSQPDSSADHKDDNDDQEERTVCFSQESTVAEQKPDNDVMLQPNHDMIDSVAVAGEDDDVMLQTEVMDSNLTSTKDDEMIVDMTQMELSANHASPDDENSEDGTTHGSLVKPIVKMTPVEEPVETIVDMTQMDSDAEMDDATPKAKGAVAPTNVVRNLQKTESRSSTHKLNKKNSTKESFTENQSTEKKTPVEASNATEILISPERSATLKQNEALRLKSIKRLKALTDRIADGLDEEKFNMPDPSSITATEFGEELSQQAVVKLAAIVQGKDLPLSDMSSKAFEVLKSDFPNVTLDSLSEKIKTYFTREIYLSCSPTELKTLDKFHDNSNRMWRWEIMSLELLPDDVASKVRKAQTARKKVRSHSKAFVTLLRALDDADKLLLDASSKEDQCQKVMAKIMSAEENVLKFERAAEKVRLTEEAKRLKEEEKRMKEEAKKQALLEKHKEKEVKEREIAVKKEEALKKKEDEKEKKRKEDAEKKREEEEAKKTALKKNKARLMTFFSTKKSKPTSPRVAPAAPAPIPSDEFWKRINSCDSHKETSLFSKPSDMARASRKRCTKMVPVSVYEATSIPTDAFNEQNQYAEQKTVYFPNKYKFLSFHEDHRPPYHGTWSKHSTCITGRTPFGQDKDQLNYEEDSEAEWEEGDDEMGEDLQDETGDDDEENMDPDEGDTHAYNYKDGWMAEDDDVVYENEEIDDETKLLRKQMKAAEMLLSEEIVAPFDGGIPLVDAIKQNSKVDLRPYIHINNETQSDSLHPLKSELLNMEAEILCSDAVCLDAYPPNLLDENFVGDPSTIGTFTSAPKNPVNQEMTNDDVKIFAGFVHHSTFPSKDRLVEVLRTEHPTVTSSRAQATRKLDSIATKRRNPFGGVIWEVSRDILEELGLKEQLAMKIPQPEPTASKEKKAQANANDTTTSSAAAVAGTKTANDKTKKREKKRAVLESLSVTTETAKKEEEITNANTKKRKHSSGVSTQSAALLARFLAGNKKGKTS